MLIIEIILTIFAWRKGWKWLSLIPLGAALLLGLLMGFFVGASGGDLNAAKGLAIFLDLLAIVALIVMVSKKPASAMNSTPTQENK
jgi:uncharacterized membrane protein YfcA